MQVHTAHEDAPLVHACAPSPSPIIPPLRSVRCLCGATRTSLHPDASRALVRRRTCGLAGTPYIYLREHPAEDESAWADGDAQYGRATIGYVYLLHIPNATAYHSESGASTAAPLSPQSTPRSPRSPSSPKSPNIYNLGGGKESFLAKASKVLNGDKDFFAATGQEPMIARRWGYFMAAQAGLRMDVPDAFIFTPEAVRASGLKIVRTYRIINPLAEGMSA